jgi:hypothetical protein
MKVLMAGVKDLNSFSPNPTPLKHHRRIPPLLKMVKKSSIVAIAVEQTNK